MPHAIRIRLQTDIAEGLLSSEIGTTADESNRIAVNGKYSLPGSNFIAMSPMKSFGNAPVAVFHPYPVKPLLLQGSLLPIRPLMPHNNLNKHMILADMTAFSGETGVTYEDARENLLYAPLFAVPLRYAPTPSLSSVFFTRPLVSLNIGRLPYTSVSMARKAIRPLMPHSIRRRLIMEKLTAVFSCNTGLVVVTSNTNPFEKSRNAFKCLSTISTLTISG